jgi:pimeloyl-ACP methyl ester carboxylesterase/predicted dehydrogenase
MLIGVAALASAQEPVAPRLRLRDSVHEATQTPIRQGSFWVYEDRASQAGRVLELDVVVLPALRTPGEPDPVFVFAGGPGQNVTSHVGRWAQHWMRQSRDIVLVSQRGTGGNNCLTCELPGSDDNLQGYLEPAFDVEAFRACLAELQQRADLTLYSTPLAMDDINDVRQALGYDQINLYGGSYGSRAELVYMRRHPETVRCAILNSVAPIAFKNPLYHARAAQDALEEIFKLTDAKPARRAVFGDLRQKFETVLACLDREPAEATVRHPVTGEPVQVHLSRAAFAEALRIIMYYDHSDVARLILSAYEGDFDLIAQQGMMHNRALRNSLALGMLLCVTCAEDVARIEPDEIVRETRGTFLGDGRVRRQMEICRFWPKSQLPANYGEPVQVYVPVLLLSGTLDPVTPPRWGAEAATHLPKATHVVAPGSHGLSGPCIDDIVRAFLDDPQRPVDTSCVEQLQPGPFRIPPRAPDRETPGEVVLMTLDPGHFHAALVQKTMYEQISPEVYVYAPPGSDVEDHLRRIEAFNTRAEQPTHWREHVYAADDFLEKLLEQRPGNVVVISGNNRNKVKYIRACVDAGLNVLADKPMCIDAAGCDLLAQAFASAKKDGVLLYDIMTERSEITTILQRRLVNTPELFGQLQKGSADDPAVIEESVHHFFKHVAGNPIKRPAWYFDTTQQGEGIVDVTTHLVDLVQWECFPNEPLDFDRDVKMLKARRWPTLISRTQFEQVTHGADFPDYLKDELNDDGLLPVYANGEMIYTLKGVHVRVTVKWDFQAPAGAGDTHYSVMRGTKANVIIRQGPEQNYRPELYVEPAPGADRQPVANALSRAMAEIQQVYPGIGVRIAGSVWQVVIPERCRVGHEAHFRQVTERYLKYLVDGKLPDWEVPNMLTKYRTTTAALDLARQ